MLTYDGWDIKWKYTRTTRNVAIALVCLIALPFALPSFVYQGFIESRLHKYSGLEFDFKDEFSLSLAPSIKIEAEYVDFKGEMAKDVEIFGTIDDFSLELDLFDFIIGRIHVKEFLVSEPKATINGNFASHTPSWIRDKLQVARKQDVRYLELLHHFIEQSIFDSAKIVDGTIQWNRAKNSMVSARSINITMEKPETGRDLTIHGTSYVNDRSVGLDIRLQRPDQFLRGYRSKLSFEIDSTPFQIEFNGNAAHRSSFVAEGDFRLEIPSLYQICTWFNDKRFCKEDRETLLVLSQLKLKDHTLSFEDASYTLNPMTFTANGGVDFRGILPRLDAVITVPVRDIEKKVMTLETLREIDLSTLFFNQFNANVDLKYTGLTLPSGYTVAPKFNFHLMDGRLAVSTKNLQIFDGLANFRMRWSKINDKGNMDFRMDGEGINLKTFQEALSKNFNVDGSLGFIFEVQSKGSKIRDLIETAKVNGSFSVMDGVIHNVELAQALTNEPTDRFEFAETNASFKGDRGQLTSQDIGFKAPSVDVDGIGNIDFLNQSLKLHLNSAPTAENKAQNGDFKGYINLSGPFYDLALNTSKDGEVLPTVNRAIHSGLLEHEDVDPIDQAESLSDDEEMVIEETDLFD